MIYISTWALWSRITLIIGQRIWVLDSNVGRSVCLVSFSTQFLHGTRMGKCIYNWCASRHNSQVQAQAKFATQTDRIRTTTSTASIVVLSTQSIEETFRVRFLSAAHLRCYIVRRVKDEYTDCHVHMEICMLSLRTAWSVRVGRLSAIIDEPVVCRLQHFTESLAWRCCGSNIHARLPSQLNGRARQHSRKTKTVACLTLFHSINISRTIISHIADRGHAAKLAEGRTRILFAEWVYRCAWWEVSSPLRAYQFNGGPVLYFKCRRST